VDGRLTIKCPYGYDEATQTLKTRAPYLASMSVCANSDHSYVRDHMNGRDGKITFHYF